MTVRHVWPLICFLVSAPDSRAQPADLPKEEFKLFAPVTAISMEKGQKDSIHVAVVRSRSFKNGTATLKVDTPNVSGLAILIKPLPGQPDHYVMHVSASAETPPGEYYIIPACTLRNKTKGIVLKLTIK